MNKRHEINGDYRKNGYTFIEKLSSCDKPLPSNTHVYFELKRLSDEFYLMRSDADTEKYKANVTRSNIYVAVAWMQLEMLQELELKIPKETVKNHFRWWTVRQMGIPQNKSDFYSDSLFAESENPVRIFFMIVDLDSYNGNYHKNPFNLVRKWSVTVEGRQNVALAPEANNFQQQLNHMQEMLNVIMN